MEPNHHIWPLGHMDCGSEEKGSRGLLLFLVLLGLLVDEIVASECLAPRCGVAGRYAGDIGIDELHSLHCLVIESAHDLSGDRRNQWGMFHTLYS
jgi:hypothetical protein